MRIDINKKNVSGTRLGHAGGQNCSDHGSGTCKFAAVPSCVSFTAVPNSCGRVSLLFHHHAQGIGAATAQLFAKHGARVVVNDLDLEPAQQVVSAIREQGGEGFAVAGSVTDEDFPVQSFTLYLSPCHVTYFVVQGIFDGKDSRNIWPA